MSRPIYILRFDDICPTMNWKIWGRVEEIMYKYDIKPIIGVIPENEDPLLNIEPVHPHYWEKLLEWQSHGWVIALHGYRHKYENTNGGIIKVNSYSEFAGVPFEIQLERLKKGIKIIRSHGLECKTWIAPAHSFDMNTVKCLNQIGIDVISDGYSSDVFKRCGLKWVPCQLYRFLPRKKGVWTVCKHPSMWDEKDLIMFEKEIEKWHTSISTFDDALIRFKICSSYMLAINSIVSSFICQRNYFMRIVKDKIRCGFTVSCKRQITSFVRKYRQA